MNKTARLIVGALAATALIAIPPLHAAEKADSPEVLGQFEIQEPLGLDWHGDWIDRQVTVDTDGNTAEAGNLNVIHVTDEGPEPLPAQFYRDGVLLGSEAMIKGESKLRVLTQVFVEKGSTQQYRVVTGRQESRTPRLQVEETAQAFVVKSTDYTARFGKQDRSWMTTLQRSRGKTDLAQWQWPKEVTVTGVSNRWHERGPARAVLERVFQFADPDRHYRVQFTFWANDPWIGVTDDYHLAEGTHLELNLRHLDATGVYHPHTYNARTFSPGGEAEDKTTEPPQHPIATLAPIWRDIWYGGGPFAYVYNESRRTGLGIAAVNGSDWTTSEGISLRSQSLEVHGADDEKGEVFVTMPTDGGRRHWALIVTPPDVCSSIGDLVRRHNDLPLDRVLDEWVLDWESDCKSIDYGLAGQWYGYFNKHVLNPTTFPRRVSSFLNGHFSDGIPQKELQSKDLAALAYIFMNPDYWPPPEKGWGNVGNPNFHTDMYNIPLKIGLLMPDHPHSDRWVNYGVKETKENIYRDSYPSGAWAESLSYSGFFFDIVENCVMLKKAGAADPFEDWPRIRKVAHYLAAMHTPVDPRYGNRQMAPIGDTHPGNYIEHLNTVGEQYLETEDRSDYRFGRQLKRFDASWEHPLDISSRELYGFGAMLRGNAYDRDHESFVTIKAGPARNHFQGDELSFYFASLSTPLAIDYACHYSPRPWHAAMHNRPDINNKRPVAIGRRRAFVETPVADVFVADERTRRINHVPLKPHETRKPGWEYDWSTLPEESPWTMRRYTMLVTHDPAESSIPDYLVIRDEIESPEPVWWNLHVLARTINQTGQTFHFSGQLDVDLEAHFLTPSFETSQYRQWGWHGDTGSLRELKGKAYEKKHFGAWIPDDFKRGTWGHHDGEMAKWLRVKEGSGHSNWLVILVPHRKGQPAPTVQKLSPTRARIRVGNDSEMIELGSEAPHQAAVTRNGKTTVLLDREEVKPWQDLKFKAPPEKGSPDDR